MLSRVTLKPWLLVGRASLKGTPCRGPRQVDRGALNIKADVVVFNTKQTPEERVPLPQQFSPLLPPQLKFYPLSQEVP